MSNEDFAREFYRFAKDRVSALPYADESEAKSPVRTLAEEFRKHSPLEILRWESGLSDPLYRVLALDFLRHSSRTTETTTWSAGVREGDVLVEGDLHVTGNFTNLGHIVVLGDVQIDGAYVAYGDYPTLSVGGGVRVNNIFVTQTETLCLETLDVRDAIVATDNHTVTIAKSLKAPVTLTEDAHLSAALDCERHIENPGYNVELYAELFDVPPFDEDDSDFDPWKSISEPIIAWMRATPPR